MIQNQLYKLQAEVARQVHCSPYLQKIDFLTIETPALTALIQHLLLVPDQIRI